MDLTKIVEESAKRLGYESLREKQKEAVITFIGKKDTFVSLPTGYGKSVIYAVLPLVFDTIRGEAQMKPEAELSVIKGDAQLVYISPENLIENIRFRKMLLSPVYHENMVALIVDEAHCVKTWGDSFRIAFAHIGNLRSLLPLHVRIMALTATATYDTLNVVKERLSMEDPSIVSLSPNRPNIMYKVKPSIDLEELSSKIAEELQGKRAIYPKTILFCRKYGDCYDLYSIIRHKMGKNFTEPCGYPDLLQFRMVEMYTRVSTPVRREEIVTAFTAPDSRLRLVIATIAFGMGIDCPNIRRVLHWGLPSDREEYAQESGRAGRDGEDAEAILFKGKTGRHASKGMIAYCHNSITCRRYILLDGFIDYIGSEHVTKSKCCDICASC